jgi:CubicO group peptidase (beta-lactamase class C family)
MLGRLLRISLLGLLGAGQPVSGDPLAAFDAWADAQGADQRGIAIWQAGGIVASRNAGTPFDLASNSKAITALCVLSLVEEGRLDWDMTLSDALGQAAPAATLAELVTHSAGIAPDSTQLRMGFWLNEDSPRHAHVTAIVLDRWRQRGTRGVFQYNNENYALLGRVIEIAGQGAYEEICRARVLAPAGVDGALSPRFGGFAGWGGWRMTMADHARLIAHWFGPGSALGADPLALPHARREAESYYGLGMGYRADADGWRMSHAGAISIPFGPKTGAYVTRLPDGTVVATAYDVAVARPERFRALDRVLSDALRAGGAGQTDRE